MYQGDGILRLSNLVIHVAYPPQMCTQPPSILPVWQAMTHPASQHLARMAGHDPSTPQWMSLREGCHHAHHHPKERFLSLLPLYPVVNSGLEKRYLKGNELTVGACWLLSPEPGVPGFLGFPPRELKRKTIGTDKDKAFPDPLFSVLL